MNTKFSTWRFYNGAVLPATEPKENVDLSPLNDGSIWNFNGKYPLFARWTSNFDCKQNTEWWWLIKDSLYEPLKLPSDRRRHIRKARENFTVKIINPCEFLNDIKQIYFDAWEDFPDVYRPGFNEKDFNAKFSNLDNTKVFGCFSNEDSSLCCFIIAIEKSNAILLSEQKSLRKYERLKSNFAVIDGFLNYYNEDIKKGKYIVDGERNLVHQTNFQEFLCKYFDFRKANCKLNLMYNPIVRPFANILFLFRRLLYAINNKQQATSSLLYKICSVLKMHEISVRK